MEGSLPKQAQQGIAVLAWHYMAWNLLPTHSPGIYIPQNISLWHVWNCCLNHCKKRNLISPMCVYCSARHQRRQVAVEAGHWRVVSTRELRACLPLLYLRQSRHHQSITLH